MLRNTSLLRQAEQKSSTLEVDIVKLIISRYFSVNKSIFEHKFEAFDDDVLVLL